MRLLLQRGCRICIRKREFSDSKSGCVSHMTLPVETAHPQVYHYTSRAGVEGILKNQSIWATNYRYLNDATEIILFKDRLKSILIPSAREILSTLIYDGKVNPGDFNKFGGFGTAAAKEAANFVESSFKKLDNEIYIASFCGASQDAYVRRNGLLSQWRGYGTGGGYCLEFDTPQLIRLLRKEAKRFEHLGEHISDVVYSDEEEILHKELKEAVIEAQDYFTAMVKKIVEKADGPPEATNFLISFISGITRYKHFAFKEEKEVRVVWVPVRVDEEYKAAIRGMGGEPQPEKPIKYRGGRHDRIPYLDLLDGLGAKLPINRLIVGPQSDQSNIAIEMKTMCAPLGIPVECSEIPYVTR